MSEKRPAAWGADAGAALVTVLVMLAILSALAIVVTEAARFSLRRTANQTQMDQARWYLLGAEAYAASKIASVTQRSGGLPIDQEQWQGRTFLYPLDDGVLTITLWDGANCFNLNSLVERASDGTYVANARGQAQFARLLDILNVRVEGGLVASLSDWLDSDERPGVGGAEDEAYRRDGAPYRTANTLLADVSELRSVRGFSREIVARIAPFVCARSTERPNILNANTLRLEQAPLLATAFGSALSADAAQDVIRDRPRGGWRDLDAFFAHPRLSSLELNDAVRNQFALTSDYFVMNARVRRAEFSESSTALIETRPRAHVVRRLFGVGAAERIL